MDIFLTGPCMLKKFASMSIKKFLSRALFISSVWKLMTDYYFDLLQPISLTISHRTVNYQVFTSVMQVDETAWTFINGVFPSSAISSDDDNGVAKNNVSLISRLPNKPALLRKKLKATKCNGSRSCFRNTNTCCFISCY